MAREIIFNCGTVDKVRATPLDKLFSIWPRGRDCPACRRGIIQGKDIESPGLCLLHNQEWFETFSKG